MAEKFKEMDVLPTIALGGEGSDPGRAVKALASQLQGASGRRLLARSGGELVITVKRNDRPATEGSAFPPLAWTADAKIEPAAPREERQRLVPGSPEALALLNWPGHLGGPGERVLLLAAQGFDGVGRAGCAEQANKMSASCSDDADAMRVLRSFQWNELADLPFPIREVLGFDKDGNPVDGDFER